MNYEINVKMYNTMYYVFLRTIIYMSKIVDGTQALNIMHVVENLLLQYYTEQYG